MEEKGNKLKNIGARVQRCREDMGLTQEQFADKFGYARTTLAKLESGSRDFKSTEIITLAKQLDMTCDELLRGMKTENISIHERLGIHNETVTSIVRVMTDTMRHTGGRSFFDVLFEAGFEHILMEWQSLAYKYADKKAKEIEISEQQSEDEKIIAELRKRELITAYDDKGEPLPGFYLRLDADGFLDEELRKICNRLDSVIRNAIDIVLDNKPIRKNRSAKTAYSSAVSKGRC